MPGFDHALTDRIVRKYLKLFWCFNDWGTIELLPACRIISDATTIASGGLLGVSPGEDQRF
ncbi:unnamed protein product, partial [Tilletia controversa]